jgi:hypothetical protein
VLTLAEKATGGALATLRYAKKSKKPCLHLHRRILGSSEKLLAFIEKYSVKRLNVAGSTEADEPGLYAWVNTLLQKANREMELRSTGY